LRGIGTWPDHGYGVSCLRRAVPGARARARRRRGAPQPRRAQDRRRPPSAGMANLMARDLSDRFAPFRAGGGSDGHRAAIRFLEELAWSKKPCVAFRRGLEHARACAQPVMKESRHRPAFLVAPRAGARLSSDNQQNGADDYEENKDDAKHQLRHNSALILWPVVMHTLLQASLLLRYLPQRMCGQQSRSPHQCRSGEHAPRIHNPKGATAQAS
jgi:hypothetical protein